MRVRLIRTADPHTRLVPGAVGTVIETDDEAGTLHVLWQDGSTLGLIPGEDEWTVLSDAPAPCTLCGQPLVPGCCDATDVYAGTQP